MDVQKNNCVGYGLEVASEEMQILEKLQQSNQHNKN